MADLSNFSDKLKDDEKQGQQSTQDQASGGNQGAGFINGTNAGASNTAGVGAGGVGGWTNIQSYLGANQGSGASAGLFNSKVGGEFDSEKQKLSDSSNQAKTQAQSIYDKSNISNDDANSYLNQASQAYSYNPDAAIAQSLDSKNKQASDVVRDPWSGAIGKQLGNWQGTKYQKPTGDWQPDNQEPQDTSTEQNQTYRDATGKLRTALTNDWGQTPTSYAYSLGGKAKNYGDSLGDDNAFYGTMGNIYQDATGGLSSGALALQRQFDTNNENLNSARQSALAKYAGLKSDIDQTNTDTNKNVNDLYSGFLANKNRLNSYVNNEGTLARADVDTKTNNAKDLFNQLIDARKIKDSVGADATYENKRMQNTGSNDSIRQALSGYNNTYDHMLNDGKFPSQEAMDDLAYRYQPLKSSIDQMRGEFANTGDEGKRRWNTIMDILGKQDRLAKGYDVTKEV